MAAEYELNVKFVQEIEKYPQLYNFNLPEYSRRDSADKAWREIGNKFGLTGPECKEKWKNLRCVFVRHLKPPKNGKPKGHKRPYYLTNYMQFAIPFIKIPGIGLEMVSSNPDHENDSSKLTSDQEMDENSFQSLSRPNSSLLEPRSSMPQPGAKKPKVEIKIEEASDPDVSDFIIEQPEEFDNCDVNEQNANKMFLMSLLPDMNKMSDKQRRIFKRRLLELVDDIMEQDIPTTSQNQFFTSHHRDE